MTAALVPYYIVLFIGVVLGVAGQVLLKTGAERSGDGIAQFLQPYTIVGFGVYALAALFYIVAIKRIPVSVAFPTVSLSYVVLAVIAHYLWDEPLGTAQLLGIALIVAGVIVIHRT